VNSGGGEGTLMIAILVILVLLGGLGGGAYLVVGQRQQAVRQAEIQAMEAEFAAQHAAKAADKSRVP